MPPILFFGILVLLSHLTWGFWLAVNEREERWSLRSLENQLFWISVRDWEKIRGRPGFWSLRFSLRSLQATLPHGSTWTFLLTYLLWAEVPGAWVLDLESDEADPLGAIYAQAKGIVRGHMRRRAPFTYALALLWKGSDWLDGVARFVVETATPNVSFRAPGCPTRWHSHLARVAEEASETPEETKAQIFDRADSFWL